MDFFDVFQFSVLNLMMKFYGTSIGRILITKSNFKMDFDKKNYGKVNCI